MESSEEQIEAKLKHHEKENLDTHQQEKHGWWVLGLTDSLRLSQISGGKMVTGTRKRISSLLTFKAKRWVLSFMDSKVPRVSDCLISEGREKWLCCQLRGGAQGVRHIWRGLSIYNRKFGLTWRVSNYKEAKFDVIWSKFPVFTIRLDKTN